MATRAVVTFSGTNWQVERSTNTNEYNRTVASRWVHQLSHNRPVDVKLHQHLEAKEISNPLEQTAFNLPESYTSWVALETDIKSQSGVHATGKDEAMSSADKTVKCEFKLDLPKLKQVKNFKPKEEFIEVARQETVDQQRIVVILVKRNACNDFNEYTIPLRARVVTLISNQLYDKYSIGVSLSMQIKYIKDGIPPQGMDRSIQSGQYIITMKEEVEEILDEIIDELSFSHQHFVENHAGFRVHTFIKSHVTIMRVNHSSCSTFRVLPKFLMNKRAIINVQNKDNRCFAYALLAALHPPSDHPYRPQSYDQFFALYSFDQIHYPVTFDQIPAIEDRVKVNINVFTFWDDEGRGRVPCLISNKSYPKSIDLLWWSDNKDISQFQPTESNGGHYAWIKNFSALMGDIPTAWCHTLHWCKKCLCHFQSPAVFALHERFCRGLDLSGQVYVMPREDNFIRQLLSQLFQWISCPICCVCRL